MLFVFDLNLDDQLKKDGKNNYFQQKDQKLCHTSFSCYVWGMHREIRVQLHLWFTQLLRLLELIVE